MCTVYIWELYKRRRWELSMVKLFGPFDHLQLIVRGIHDFCSLGNAVKLHRQGQHGSNLSVLIVCTYSMTLKILKLFLHRCQKTWAESDPSSIADADGMLGMQMPWLLRRSWTAHNLLYCWPVSWRQGNRETESHWDELGRLQVLHDPILLMLVLLWGTQGAAPCCSISGRPWETLKATTAHGKIWQTHANRVSHVSPRFTKYTHLAVAHDFILRTFPVPVRARCIASAQLEPTTLSNKHEHQPFPSANSHSILGSHIDAPDISWLYTGLADTQLWREVAYWIRIKSLHSKWPPCQMSECKPESLRPLLTTKILSRTVFLDVLEYLSNLS